MIVELTKSPILILDFGSQYTNLIARKLRQLNIYCQIYPFDLKITEIQKINPAGIILSGGPESVHETGCYDIAEEIFHLGIPCLGICYGMQLIAKHFRGNVEPCAKKEFGAALLQKIGNSDLFSTVFEGGEKSLGAWMSHGDQVTSLPNGFTVTARTDTCPIAAMENSDKRIYGVQFHPEVNHTAKGAQILHNFAKEICKCQAIWEQKNIIALLTEEIINKVGDDMVILGLSGGVDSSVLAALLYQAIGKQLIGVFIDTGLLRLNEAESVTTNFAKHYPKLRVIKVDARERFLDALANIQDPEEKRRIVGKTFVDVFEEQAKQLSKTHAIKWLAQGTIYSDVIESAGNQHSKGKVIKSHHNVAGLPKALPFEILEPLKELFKDEVRAMGASLAVPSAILNRHPFPGPGLAVRVIGEVKKAYVEILAKADHIFMQELHNFGWYDKVSQAFAVFLPIKSVGVMGDCRKYEWVIALRAVESCDFMTANYAQLPYELLAKTATRIVNEVPQVSRVVYDLSNKPPATIEWE